MNRSLGAVAFAVCLLNSVAADAQSWIFQPGNYTKPLGPQAPAEAAKPHAYATFTESQALEAAKLPRPAFQWDPTGVLGRGQRFEMWNHEEAMESMRLRTYAQGVRDSVGARPVWTWNGPTPQSIPQIVAPTPTAPGKTKAARRP